MKETNLINEEDAVASFQRAALCLAALLLVTKTVDTQQIKIIQGYLFQSHVVSYTHVHSYLWFIYTTYPVGFKM